jgi:2-methylisocitrate lyase-like PEP mutase family enzyme
MNQNQKAELLLQLHSAPPILVLANAWDAASARIVAAEGFPAIATSSSACAAVLGYTDGQRIPRSEMIFLIAKIAAAVDVPVTADVEAGYGDAVQTALDVIAAGGAGLNIEDMAGGELAPLNHQVEVIRAVRDVAKTSRIALVLNARTDIFLAGHGDAATRFDRAVERLNAYRDAGADCLFAPGVRDGETIGRLAREVRGPLNVLAVPGTPPIPELERLGVARVSCGGGPSRIALGALQRFARDLHSRGTFEALAAEAIPAHEMQALLARR